MFMILTSNRFDEPTDALSAGHWVEDIDLGAEHPAGRAQPHFGRGLGAIISKNPINGKGVLGCHDVEIPDRRWALRMDEVAFPVGAVAHRHTHSGSGWRYLVSGALRIENAHGSQIMKAGDCWFEPEQTPVRAVSLHNTGITRFVRAMVIDQDRIGQSTFQLCDPADGNLPRLQVTHRHFDQPYQVDTGY